MILTNEMSTAMDLINGTNHHVFITGKAGSGKTTFLKYLIQNCSKSCIVAAPTGIAAINAGGVTLHSLFLFPFRPMSPVEPIDFKISKGNRKVLSKIRMLIIDEVSMVSPDVIDMMDRKLRWIRKSQEPFGGVQIVMFGDLFQLPPVVKTDEKPIFDAFYDGYFFFNALVWKQVGFHVVELSHVFRQKDQSFVDVLNHVRNYKMDSNDLDVLSEIKDKATSEMFTGNYIHICTHKREVDKINSTLLGKPTWSSESVIEGKFSTSAVPCDITLKLRVGARVMAISNNSKQGYYNGMLGWVVGFEDNKVVVQADNGAVIQFEPYRWVNNQFEIKDGNVVATEIGACTQYPLTLAWAITIHKSQGLAFDNVALHVKHTFCPGQLYVALSRCRTLEGIASDAYITKKMVIPEKSLEDFERIYKENDHWFGRRLND